jgi:hypothetical protein
MSVSHNLTLFFFSWVSERPQAKFQKPTDADSFSPRRPSSRELTEVAMLRPLHLFKERWRGQCGASVSGGPPEKHEFIQVRHVEAEIGRRRSQDADLAGAYTDLWQYFWSVNNMEIAIIYLK